MLALEQLAESDFLAPGGGSSHRSDPPVATGLFVIAKRRSSVKIWPHECKVNRSVSPACNRCHFVPLNKDERCPTAV